MRQTIKIAIMIVAVVAAVMSGLALAQTSDDDDPGANYNSRVLEQLAPLVDEGIIDQDQADAIAEHFTQQFAERRQLFEERQEQRAEDRQELLSLLGVTEDELREAMRSGSTLADLAEEQGVARQDVIDLMVTQAQERIAAAVENGKLTQEEADEKLADITEVITDKVNNGGGFFGHGRGRHGHGPGFGFGPEGPAADAVNA
jgi:polyhydroxyalkanoate synthesis regulator phasin